MVVIWQGVLFKLINATRILQLKRQENVSHVIYIKSN